MTKLRKLLAGTAVSGVLLLGVASPASASSPFHPSEEDCQNDAEDVVVGQANICDNDIVDDVNVDVNLGG